ncbi:hypothetical protein [Natronosalvus rutilus]|uniref:Uncharacterized protein n=1 Tax=Natronosalvus rutilus TaxID=2953753 RepID=A0A9E7SSS9_9EURY|nr:hypothetical protein [Natronosalvus rutilus]UTF52914.1 hypothetical protein NGM29_14170 [Natronosalvus rutilus]
MSDRREDASGENPATTGEMTPRAEPLPLVDVLETVAVGAAPPLALGLFALLVPSVPVGQAVFVGVLFGAILASYRRGIEAVRAENGDGIKRRLRVPDADDPQGNGSALLAHLAARVEGTVLEWVIVGAVGAIGLASAVELATVGFERVAPRVLLFGLLCGPAALFAVVVRLGAPNRQGEDQR